jgi:predicted nucleotidyltransferase
LIEAVLKFDSSALIWLFGSRTDNSKKGGDIDIAVLSDKIHIREKMQLKRAIYNELGEQKIDLVVSADGNEPFFRLAIEKGIRIDG